MNELFYDMVIDHANKNIKTGGSELFNDLDKIYQDMAILSDVNSPAKHLAIYMLQKRIDYLIDLYAKKNNIVSQK